MGCASNHRPTKKKEDVLMRNENRALGNRRSLLALWMILAGVIALTILATVVGWFSTYVVPLAVLLGAGVVVLWLLVQLAKKLPGGYDISDWWQ
jgi:Flp pilus assembly protein TadB